MTEKAEPATATSTIPAAPRTTTVRWPAEMPLSMTIWARRGTTNLAALESSKPRKAPTAHRR